MVNSREHIYVNAESIKAFAIRAFMAVGVPQSDAEITTNSMLQAALRGEGDHGMRLVATWINSQNPYLNYSKPYFHGIN